MLSGGGGMNIMIGGIGDSAFIGSFDTDIMIGRFAYIVITDGRVSQVSSFWFGDDPLANPLSSVYSAGNGESGGPSTQLTGTPLTAQAAWGTGLAAGTEFQVSAPIITLAQGEGPTDLQGQQQQQSSHAGFLRKRGRPLRRDCLDVRVRTAGASDAGAAAAPARAVNLARSGGGFDSIARRGRSGRGSAVPGREPENGGDRFERGGCRQQDG